MMRTNILITSKIKICIEILSTVALMFLAGCNILLPQAPTPSPTATITTPITETPAPTIDWFPATPTPTPLPTASPTPMPTVQEDQRDGITELLVNDDFSDEGLWTILQSRSGNIAFGNQNLTLAVAEENASLFSLSEHMVPSNFYLEITIEMSLCQPEDQVGIVFWHQSEDNYYRLLINCAGEHQLELIQAGQNFVVHNWQPALKMARGIPATNRFGLWVNQGEFQLYINDAFQFTEQISRIQSGRLGVFARTVSGSAMTARFSDLQTYLVELD